MTPFIKKKEIKKDWYIINAQNAAVGRLAAYISRVLRGKNKSTYNPHIDNGDFVVVTNIDKINLLEKIYQKNIINILVIQVELKRQHLLPLKKKIKLKKF